MNGSAKWLYSIVSGIVIIIIAGWLMTTSAEVKTTSTNVAVLQSQYTQIKCDMAEIKDLVKDIRLDQLRRERKDVK